MKRGKIFKFSLGQLFLSLGLVLKRGETKTQFWLKRVFPQKQTYEKQDNPNIVAAVGVPPAEQVMGKALAYGGLDPGFHSLSNLIVSSDGHSSPSPESLDVIKSGQGLRLPNTLPLSKEEMLNVVPFRKYTFYSELDSDNFAKYNHPDYMIAHVLPDIDDDSGESLSSINFLQ